MMRADEVAFAEWWRQAVASRQIEDTSAAGRDACAAEFARAWERSTQLTSSLIAEAERAGIQQADALTAMNAHGGNLKRAREALGLATFQLENETHGVPIVATSRWKAAMSRAGIELRDDD